MRKVTFFIDDLAFFNLEAPGVDLGDKESFKAIYTLYGEGKNIERYELTDQEGNKIPLTDLNGYQKGVILNDCKAYFTGSSYHSNGTKPCGVVKIDDSSHKDKERNNVMEQQGKEREYVALDEQIREAKERQAKGEPGAAEQLRQLQQQKKELLNEIRQAGDEDYRRQRQARREKRNRLDKAVDAIGGEL